MRRRRDPDEDFLWIIIKLLGVAIIVGLLGTTLYFAASNKCNQKLPVEIVSNGSNNNNNGVPALIQEQTEILCEKIESTVALAGAGSGHGIPANCIPVFQADIPFQSDEFAVCVYLAESVRFQQEWRNVAPSTPAPSAITLTGSHGVFYGNGYNISMGDQCVTGVSIEPTVAGQLFVQSNRSHWLVRDLRVVYDEQQYCVMSSALSVRNTNLRVERLYSLHAFYGVQAEASVTTVVDSHVEGLIDQFSPARAELIEYCPAGIFGTFACSPFFLTTVGGPLWGPAGNDAVGFRVQGGVFSASGNTIDLSWALWFGGRPGSSTPVGDSFAPRSIGVLGDGFPHVALHDNTIIANQGEVVFTATTLLMTDNRIRPIPGFVNTATATGSDFAMPVGVFVGYIQSAIAIVSRTHVDMNLMSPDLAAVGLWMSVGTGELNDNVVAGNPPPIADYVSSRQGYNCFEGTCTNRRRPGALVRLDGQAIQNQADVSIRGLTTSASGDQVVHMAVGIEATNYDGGVYPVPPGGDVSAIAAAITGHHAMRGAAAAVFGSGLRDRSSITMSGAKYNRGYYGLFFFNESSGVSVSDSMISTTCVGAFADSTSSDLSLGTINFNRNQKNTDLNGVDLLQYANWMNTEKPLPHCGGSAPFIWDISVPGVQSPAVNPIPFPIFGGDQQQQQGTSLTDGDDSLSPYVRDKLRTLEEQSVRMSWK